MPDKNPTENEFNVFGIAKIWRGGLLTAILTFMTAAIIGLYCHTVQLGDDIAKRDAEQIIYLRSTVDKMNNASSNANRMVDKIDSVITTQIDQKGGSAK